MDTYLDMSFIHYFYSWKGVKIEVSSRTSPAASVLLKIPQICGTIFSRHHRKTNFPLNTTENRIKKNRVPFSKNVSIKTSKVSSWSHYRLVLESC